MGIAEKIANAKETNWMTKGLSESEIMTTIELAKISAKLERCRLDMGMTQKEFADYMNVTQGMVSKWESREYNFTIKSLIEICQKLNQRVTVNMDYKCVKRDYTIVKWNAERFTRKGKSRINFNNVNVEEAIA